MYRYGVEYINGKLIGHERPINPKTSYKIRKDEAKIKEELEKKKLKMSKREKSEECFLNRTESNKESSTVRTLNTTTNKSGFGTTKENIYRSEDFIQSYLNNKIAEITKSFDLRETVITDLIQI